MKGSNNGSGMSDQELERLYPIQDDTWPSRRWNKEMSESIDLSGHHSSTEKAQASNVSGSGVYEHNYWEENGKSWYQYIHTFEIYRQKDKNYVGKSFKHKRCPFCQRITSMAPLHWFSHLNKCSPKEYSMADIGELRYKKLNELRGQRIGR